jgi:hypothetical protein
MGKLTGQTIAASYDQLLIVDHADGISSSLQAVESADTGGSASALQISTVAAAIDNPTTSSATQGGKLTLFSDDGAALGDTHRLGVIEFSAAEDTSSTITIGARIEAIADAAWSASENGADMVFYTTDGNASQSEVLRLTADNLVGIGGNPSGKFHVIADTNDEVMVATSGDISGTFADAGGSYPQGTKLSISRPHDGTHDSYFVTYGTGSESANLGIHARHDIVFASNTNEVMRIDSAGDVTLATGNLVIGTAGKGIMFHPHDEAVTGPPGSDSNLLDDYEEGTWTPVVSDGTNPMTMNGTYDTGYYTKVGNLVTVSGMFVTTSAGSASGDIRITGLPFTIANATAAYSGGGAAYGSNFAITAGHSVSCLGAINDTFIELRVWDATTGTSGMQASEWSADGAIMIGFSYRAA